MGLENQEGLYYFYIKGFIVKAGVLYLIGVLINRRQVVNYLFSREEGVCQVLGILRT